MQTENKLMGILKVIGIALLLPGIFFLFMGPMKLAQMYPDHQWLRYLPVALLIIPACILAFGKKSNDGGGGP